MNENSLLVRNGWSSGRRSAIWWRTRRSSKVKTAWKFNSDISCRYILFRWANIATVKHCGATQNSTYFNFFQKLETVEQLIKIPDNHKPLWTQMSVGLIYHQKIILIFFLGVSWIAWRVYFYVGEIAEWNARKLEKSCKTWYFLS